MCLKFLKFTLYTTERRDYLCGTAQYYNSPNGTIKSHAGFDAGHNYGKNMHCTWVIEAQPGWKVELVADSFDVQRFQLYVHFTILESLPGKTLTVSTGLNLNMSIPN